MWGSILGIAAAASALALAQTLLEAYKEEAQKTPEKPHQLPEPDEGNKGSGKKVWKAPLWQEGTAKEVLERARKISSKMKR